MELIRLGYYNQVLQAMLPHVTYRDDIVNFKNDQGKNAFDLINQLIKDKKGDPIQVKKLWFLKRYLYGKNTYIDTSLSVFHPFQKMTEIKKILILPNVSNSNTELISFSPSEKRFLLQELSLAGVKFKYYSLATFGRSQTWVLCIPVAAVMLTRINICISQTILDCY